MRGHGADARHCRPMKNLVRYLWPAPWTALGLACALAACAAGARGSWRGDTLEVTGGKLLAAL